MVIFQNIRYRNFLSVGDNFVEVDLDSHPTTLIVGGNGEGKSILLDALSFVLFGKPHRNINKPQLVNTINEKNMLVEIAFQIGRTKYKIRRGIRPNIFEIYKNDEMINQSNKSRDYQKILETNILKLNHKSFHQIVVLGSSTFIPFMQLLPYHRRGVIEDLLDISIFSKMNLLLREKRTKLRDKITAVDQDIHTLASQIALQKKHIAELESITTKNKSRILKDIEGIEEDIAQLTTKNAELQANIDSQDSIDVVSLAKSREELRQYGISIKHKIHSIVTQTEFFKTKDSCPTCLQTITAATKEDMIGSLTEKLDKIEGGYIKLEAELAKVELAHAKGTEILRQRNKFLADIDYNLRSITTKAEEKNHKRKVVAELTDDDKLAESQKDLEKLFIESAEREKEHLAMQEYTQYFGVVEELLKDTGIKTRIIQQYLPIMNKLINEYLQIFEFFVSFTIDENFNEKIRSRHRDDFSYASFSEGEKSRIDLALMFTWRQIAKLKNSTNVNLLILDEIMDASLDEAGLAALKTVFVALEKDSNIFVISHRGEVKESSDFSRIIQVFKKDLFTAIKVEV